MKTTLQSLEEGFEKHPHLPYWRFVFGDGYELAVEPVLFDNQSYIALYKDGELLTNKIPFAAVTRTGECIDK